MDPVEIASSQGRFSTQALAPRLRLQSWQRFVRETFVDVHVQPEQAADFNAAAEYRMVDQLRFGMVRSTRSVVQHLVKPASAQEHFMLHLQERGTCLHEQGGRQTMLARGQISLSDMSRPYRLDVSEDNRMILVVLPAQALRERLAQAPDLVCRALGREQRSVALLVALLRCVMAQQHVQPGCDPADEPLQTMVFDLLGAALQPWQANDPGAQRRARIQAQVQQHLADPELRLAAVAAPLGLSQRQVQRAFAETGTTFSLYLLEQRLQAAHSRLGKDGRSASVTQVALDCGFNDLSYFGRAFKRRFGCSPREAKGGAAAGSNRVGRPDQRLSPQMREQT